MGLDLGTDETHFQNKSKYINFPPTEEQDLGTEVKKLLQKQVIAPSQHEELEFISPIFLTRKDRNKVKLILNLKELNQNLETTHFKMDTIYSVLKLITPGCYMSSVDIKDAYYSVPISEGYQKYFKFKYKGTLYKFLCLPNGFCHGPRKFTKLLKPPLAYLRKMNHILAAYIDDLLNIGTDYGDCVRNVMDTILIFDKLGFIIHPEKSQLIPSREITYLGFIINSRTMTIRLTDEKKESLRDLGVQLIAEPHPTIRRVASIIGKITASFPGVKAGPLHYRYLEGDKMLALRKNKGHYDKKMELSFHAIRELSWWRDHVITSCHHIRLRNPTVTLTTDASETGWGATLGHKRAHGGWKHHETRDHINLLELRAVLIGLQVHTPQITDAHILVLCDNTTAVCTINKMGTSKSWECNNIVWDIWDYILVHDNWITASYIPGKENIEADEESRKDNTNKEWMLQKKVFTNVTEELHTTPVIDLFASRVNYQLKPFVSFLPDPEALHVNAFTLDWSRWHPFYAFPPFALIMRTLSKIQHDGADAIVIVPNWPNQIWFPVIMRMLVDIPLILHSREKLLQLPNQPELIHPMLPKMRILACKVSGDPTKHNTFLQGYLKSSWPDGAKAQKTNTSHVLRDSLGTVINGMWIHFRRQCTK